MVLHIGTGRHQVNAKDKIGQQNWRLISIFTFLMSSMVMYMSSSDHNVVCHDIWFRIKRNLGPFLVTFRSLLTSSEVRKVPNFCY